jgi:pimeloyl-ACP methyl ester carboxylesterase
MARPPPAALLLNEVAALLRPAPRLDVASLARTLPRGDGHAVLVLPPALRADGLTREVRMLLDRLGYAPSGWGLGLDLGPTRHLLEGSARRLGELTAQYGPVSLVGFSMGGLFARWLALQSPVQVRRLITVGSPFRDPLDSTTLPLRQMLRLWGEPAEVRHLARLIARTPPVPATFLYSRSDGIVDWECCHEPGADNVEFAGPHMTMVQSEDVLRVVADRLSRPASRAGTPGPSPAV